MAPIRANSTYRKRRIIVAIDGTWLDVDYQPDQTYYSNMTRLLNCIAPTGQTASGETVEQIKFYEPGVGTAEGMWGATIAGGLGIGMLSRARSVYLNIIAQNYRAGDDIILCGFSRGAAIARLVATFVEEVGVMDSPEWRELFPSLFDALSKHHTYPDENTKQGRRAAEKLSHFLELNKPFREVQRAKLKKLGVEFAVKAVCVFDTVSVRGRPPQLRFGHSHALDFNSFGVPEAALSPAIQHAFQALAIDESRPAFKPDIWKLDPRTNGPKQVLRQCWFSGIHIDCGGGALRHDLSDITLGWMIGQLEKYDLLTFEQGELDQIAAHPAELYGELPPKSAQLYGWHDQVNKVRLPSLALNKLTNERVHPSVRCQLKLQAYTARLITNAALFEPLEPFEEEIRSRWKARVVQAPINFIPGPTTVMGKVHARMRGWEERLADEKRKATGAGDLHAK